MFPEISVISIQTIISISALLFRDIKIQPSISQGSIEKHWFCIEKLYRSCYPIIGGINMELFMKIVGIVVISIFSFLGFIMLFTPQGIFTAIFFILFGIMSGSVFLALEEIIKQLRKIADKQPITVESKTIYAEKPQVVKKTDEPYWWENTADSTASFDARRCKKCGAPLADSYTSSICTSCQYGAPHKANSDSSSL